MTSPALADVKAGVDAWTAGDFATAVREWAGPAAQGDPDAQFNMAQAYRLGRGVETNLDQAEALYARAADQGHVKAADNFGLLLFQRGAREQAMPYVEAAAMRGDPRAQYVLGIAHFNGDLVAKDWRRAYALLTLANSAGLPQARGALAQMDDYIPLADREAAQPLAASLKAEAEAARARQLAAVDLATGGTDAPSVPATVRAPAPRPSGTPRVAGSAPRTTTAPGADYTLPAAQPTVVARREETLSREAVAAATRPAAPVAAAPASAPAAATRTAPSSGPWKVQLGAFGVAGNAERLWNSLSGRSEIAGRQRLLVKSGNLTKLLAGGYASRDQAAAACASLKRSGQGCLVTR
ncbi:SPOR domain-containing protein [Qipengyuania flava]|uniref:SPOR domain-containing protein n=1 Tax=Qipengyuania flava TaxID=192812 RepID=UPI001C638866|nr:SPOR domain-containing protein [Qipengyuania flava]QYJ07919.1 SPOR domain-containing protein [Qipengyuania flava]